MFRKMMITLLLIAIGLVSIVVIRTLQFTPPVYPATLPVSYAVDAQQVARHLSAAISFPTVSTGDLQHTPREPFEAFIGWLGQTYPLIQQKLTRERLGKYSLLYHWPGRGSTQKPILLTAHYDVVPVPQASLSQWQHDPFAGDIADGWVWGRGALDDKSAVISLLEAVTLLLQNGYQPERDIYLAFGHDEEVGGEQGAGSIVQAMKTRGIDAAWSLDEGSFVLDGILPGLSLPLASINTSEKGYLTVQITARSAGGHSSLPPHDMAIYTLADVLGKLHKANFPVHLDTGPGAEMLDAVARHMPFAKRMLFANRWLFGPLLERVLIRSPTSVAMLHTTIAPTMLQAGIKENVLAPAATATVNLRIHPLDTVEAVITRLKHIIKRDGVSLTVVTSVPASTIARSTSPGFKALSAVARKIFAGAVVTPGLTIGATDSTHYHAVADASYLFNPMVITPADLASFHGVNERMSIDNLARAVKSRA